MLNLLPGRKNTPKLDSEVSWSDLVYNLTQGPNYNLNRQPCESLTQGPDSNSK